MMRFAKTDNARQFVYAVGCIGIGHRQTSECFSDDFKFPLACPTKEVQATHLEAPAQLMQSWFALFD